MLSNIAIQRIVLILTFQMMLYVVYVLITTDINYGNSTDCSNYAAGRLVTSIDAGGLKNFTGITISDDAADGFIATDYGDSTDFADTNVSNDAVDVLMILVG